MRKGAAVSNRTIPFAEDTFACRFEHLADYIAEFRAPLDGHRGLLRHYVRPRGCRGATCASGADIGKSDPQQNC